MRIFYFLMLAFSVVFHILYKGDLSFVLLMFMIILPIVTLIMTIVSAFTVHVSAGFEHLSALRGQPAVLKVNVRNKSLLPIGCCVVELFYISHIPFDTPARNRYRLSAAIGAKASEAFAFNITSQHCGTADVYVKRVLIRDYLRIFSIPVRVSAKGKCVSSPVLYPVQATIESMPVSADDGTAFSPYKSGDDPSEIFALREYREGDSNNRIHWKLSSRSENFIVKELSLPIGCNILLVTDFYSCTTASATDRILDSAFSVSNLLVEFGTAHTLAYARSDYSVKRAEIDTEDKRLAAASELCSELGNAITDFPFARAAASDEFFSSRKHFSRVIIFTDSTDFARTEELEALFGEAYITIICSGTPDTTDDEKCRTEIIYADAEKLSNHELLII
ncbi:MAG: DUF58 domain-containing protein [Oscillospiraceae bacterium]|nr:DUF58 domain-containing protein [Oscillospiraceae bacterium]